MMQMLPLRPEDQEAVDELCREQNLRHGTDYAPPRLVIGDAVNPNVVMALKIVERGRMRQAHIFERQLELMTFGGNPRATEHSLRELPAAMFLLEKKGYEGFHARIGRGFLGQWERSLVDRLRMTQDDERLVHFYRSFRETR